jgi:DNA-binding GntR family transcriptional regulator
MSRELPVTGSKPTAVAKSGRRSRSARSPGAVPPPTYKEQVVALLQDAIFNGSLRSGQRIDHDAISRHLGVSRLPVREALLVLEQEGFITMELHRGAFVAELTPDDIRDHYELYARVGAFAAGRSATVLLDDDVDGLVEMVAAMKGTSDPSELYELSFEFYREVYRTGASRMLRLALRDLARTIPAWLFAIPDPALRRDTARYAEGVVQALRRRDSAAVETLVGENILRNGQSVVRRLQESGFWDVEEPVSKPRA